MLSGLLFMLTLGAYLRYVRRPFSLVHYVGMAALFALGLMCKPMLVTLPFVLLLLDYWPLGRFAGQLSPVAPEWCGGTWLAANAAAGRPPQPSVLPMLEGRFSVAHRLLIEKLPLFALSAASCVATAVAQRHAVQSIDRFSPVARAANALVSYATYLGQFSCPAGLAAYYPHQKGDLPLWQVMAAALLLAIITAGAAAYRRRYPWFCVGWFWYVGMLVPVIGLVQVGTQAMADRYTYLPQIGLAIALTWGAIHAIESWPNRIQVCGVVSALVVVLMLGCTWQQVSYWRNSGTLWTHALACTSGNAIAHDNLGVFLREQGRRDEAICHFQEALEIKPDCVNFQSNFGACLCELGYVDEAAAHIRKAVEADPGNADLRLCLRQHPGQTRPAGRGRCRVSQELGDQARPRRLAQQPRFALGPRRGDRRGDPTLPHGDCGETPKCAALTTTSETPWLAKTSSTRPSRSTKSPWRSSPTTCWPYWSTRISVRRWPAAGGPARQSPIAARP